MNETEYMASPDINERELDAIAKQLRIEIINMIHKAGSGHAGGSLSLCEIMAVLYFKIMRIDPNNPLEPGRDRLILSKGHAAPVLYAAMAIRGFFPMSELNTLRRMGSRLQGHPDMIKLPGIEISSGSLGMGISFGVGTSLGAGLNGLDYRTFVIVGDGELNEGQNWEALMAAPKLGTKRLSVIVDYNKVQLDGSNKDIMPVSDLRDKLEAFNWTTLECDGHDTRQVINALESALQVEDGPVAIIAHTIKGKGISFMENKHQWHGAAIDHEAYDLAMKELGGN